LLAVVVVRLLDFWGSAELEQKFFDEVFHGVVLFFNLLN
jgi:hypothetical protein